MYVFLLTYISQQSVDEVTVDDDSMDTAKGNKEEKPSEVGVVTVTHTGVDPWTVVIHLHHTSVQ